MQMEQIFTGLQFFIMKFYTWKRNVQKNTTPYARWKRLGNDMAAAKKRLKYTRYDARGRPIRLDRTVPNNVSSDIAHIGRNQKAHHSKTNEVYGDVVTIGNASLYGFDCCRIPRNTTGNAINARERDTILLKGIKITSLFVNQTAVPMYVRVALVNPKISNTLSELGFFRGHGLARAIDFGGFAGGVKQGLIHRSDPINSDKYNILKTWSLELGPQDQDTTTTQTVQAVEGETEPTTKSLGLGPAKYNNCGGCPCNYKHLNEYVRINRYFSYQSDDQESCTEKLYLCYWFTLAEQAAGDAPVDNAVKMEMRAITYFNEADH